MKRRNKYMNKYRRCPVCKHYMINSEYDFCPHCDWQLDSFQEKYPDEIWGDKDVKLKLDNKKWFSRKEFEIFLSIRR